jgi:glycosyltransferase involved in cell wall biosynthesis
MLPSTENTLVAQQQSHYCDATEPGAMATLYRLPGFKPQLPIRMRFRLFGRYRRLKERIASLERLLQAKLAENQAAIAALHGQVATLHGQSGDLQARLDSARESLGALDARVAADHAALSSANAAAARERDELQKRNALIERLLTGTSSARPPGAALAVAQLAKPCVAVILPTHNRARFVTEAIASVQRQSFQDWELIVVDDGSMDGTDSAVAPFLDDRRITYLRQEKSNPSAARNRGVRESSAPFIAYLDSDNVWYPDFLACAVDCLATESEVDLVYGALVSDHHNLTQRCILWERFDRDRLLSENFMDTNVLVHRRTLVNRFGGWDPSLDRLSDWDLVLRYTSEKPARPLGVLAAYYRVCDRQRVTDVVPIGPSYVEVARKWFPPATLRQRPRVLYAVWHYPHLSETYVESELLCMKQWGVQVEVWRSAEGRTSYPTSVPIHDGTFADVIKEVQPDIIHVHWLSFAQSQLTELAASGIPVTLRLHSFDVTPEGLAAWLAHDWVKAVYAFPNQIAKCPVADPRLKPTPVGFDTKLFAPRRDKNRRLVVRTSAALASKDLALFLNAARLLPEYRFVLAAVTCHGREEYVGDLQATREALGSPAEILIDVPREKVAELVAQAGIYVHTLCPPGAEHATPVGQPISITEAMATGCLCLVRDVPDLEALVGDAGSTYRDLDQLVERIRATGQWTDEAWSDVQKRAIDRAFMHHADVLVFREMFNDWVKLSEKPALSPTI